MLSVESFFKIWRHGSGRLLVENYSQYVAVSEEKIKGNLSEATDSIQTGAYKSDIYCRHSCLCGDPRFNSFPGRLLFSSWGLLGVITCYTKQKWSIWNCFMHQISSAFAVSRVHEAIIEPRQTRGWAVSLPNDWACLSLHQKDWNIHSVIQWARATNMSREHLQSTRSQILSAGRQWPWMQQHMDRTQLSNEAK